MPVNMIKQDLFTLGLHSTGINESTINGNNNSGQHLEQKDLKFAPKTKLPE